MTVGVKIIADSISEEKIRLTTFQLRYPRFIHSEFMTHRQFSRNASSSRAVPVKKLIQDILDDTAIPIHWGKNQKGMQADEECNEEIWFNQWWEKQGPGPYTREKAWIDARDNAIRHARAFDEAGYHKQIVNRLLEPFSHINVLVTSTKWANFFNLRDHKDAMPEIRQLARVMKDALKISKPKLLEPGEWHLPYWEDYEGGYNETALKVSVARCARVSYLTQEGKKSTVEEDLKLYSMLIETDPLHASPAEHQATPDKIHFIKGIGKDWSATNLWGNFHGWIQYRKTLRNECKGESYEV